jgi:glycine hydroxymethyltransferase
MNYDTEYAHIKEQDPEVFTTLQGEEEREHEGIELVPSENYVSRAVREANGSVFTNKYSEGYPGKRYYGGQTYTDEVERIAIDRTKKLFGANFANVQPLSGAPANVAMYFALLNPGDTILGMDLSHGGHLTHGHPVTHIAKVFNFVRYKMKDPKTGEIDFDELRAVALREKPKMILAGFSAYPRELPYKRFVEIANEIGAITVADMAHIAGLIAGKSARNPFDDGFDVMTTTTHKTLRGPRGGLILTRENEEYAKKIDKAVFPGLQGGPHMNLVAGKAVAFKEALHPSFHTYTEQILKNAKAMEEVFHREGIPMVTGGTSNHLILADVASSLQIGGKEAQAVLDEVGLSLNMNSIADDTRPPTDPSGIRFGTPALTTRGMKEAEAVAIAKCMIDTLRTPKNENRKAEIKQRVREIALAFPVPESFV